AGPPRKPSSGVRIRKGSERGHPLQARHASMCPGFLQLPDFVLDPQFPPLQFGDLERIDRWVIQCLVDFTLEFAVLYLELLDSGNKRHIGFPSPFLVNTACPAARS